MYADHNPSLKSMKTSFYWAKLERTGDNAVDEADVCYDFNADGILDGGTQAELINLDAIGPQERQLFEVRMADGHIEKVIYRGNFTPSQRRLNRTCGENLWELSAVAPQAPHPRYLPQILNKDRSKSGSS